MAAAYFNQTVIFLVGKSGSGKTEFACRLRDKHPSLFTRLTQGGAYKTGDAFFRDLTRQVKLAASTKKILIIDRCHIDFLDRAKVRKYLLPNTRIIYIHFDYQRVQLEANIRFRIANFPPHPTVNDCETMKKALDSWDKMPAVSLTDELHPEHGDQLFYFDSFKEFVQREQTKLVETLASL
jgi:predicted kinase